MNISIFLLLSTIFSDIVLSEVQQFNIIDFDIWLDRGDFLIVLFCSSVKDNSCIKELGKLNTLSEQMLEYEDLVFGYIDKETDHILISRYDVQKFPLLKLFPYNDQSQNYFLNIRIQDLKNTILEIREQFIEKLRNNEAITEEQSPIKRISLIEIDWIDLSSTVKDPEKHSMLIVYDEECNELCRVMEKVARVFANENEIGFYKLSLERTGPYQKTFTSDKYPTVYWFPKGGKEGFIYTEKTEFQALVDFVNKHAGLARSYNGELTAYAGRITEIDQLIKENILAIFLKTKIGSVIYSVESKSHELPHSKKYIEYYLTILREIKKSKVPDEVLHREQEFLNKRLLQSGLNNKETEEWRKYYNIVSAFVEFATNQLQEQLEKYNPPRREPQKAPKRATINLEMKNRAQLKHDPKWKGVWKPQSRHEEL